MGSFHFCFISTGKKSKNQNKGPGGESGGDENGKWADQTGGFRDEGQQVKIAIGDAAEDDKKPKNRPKVPEWITNSAIDQTPDESQNQSSMPTPGMHTTNLTSIKLSHFYWTLLLCFHTSAMNIVISYEQLLTGAQRSVESGPISKNMVFTNGLFT